MATVTLKNVTKRYGGVEAVHDLSLEIPDGQFTVLVGPSGCGKTSTLRMVAGLETVTSGRMFIGEREVTRLEPKHRDVAMVFQNYALYPHLAVEQNMGFPLRAKGMDRGAIARRLLESKTQLPTSTSRSRSMPRRCSRCANSSTPRWKARA